MRNSVIHALQDAAFLSHSTQGDTALALKLTEIAEQLAQLKPALESLVTDAVQLDPATYGRVISAFSVQPDFIPVYVVVAELEQHQFLHPDDRELAGHYQILVPGYLNDELQAATALDLFHGGVAIKGLEDFSITVVKTLDAPTDYENGTLESLGDFVGITAETAI